MMLCVRHSSRRARARRELVSRCAGMAMGRRGSLVSAATPLRKKGAKLRRTALTIAPEVWRGVWELVMMRLMLYICTERYGYRTGIGAVNNYLYRRVWKCIEASPRKGVEPCKKAAQENFVLRKPLIKL